jgi:acetate kinase
VATVLVVNAGSSSIKYQLLDLDDERPLAAGQVERIGDDDGARLEHVHAGTATELAPGPLDHRGAMRSILGAFAESGPDLADGRLRAFGHRVVMGGRDLASAVELDDAVVAAIERLAPLAPLHNPPALAAIAVAQELGPEVPHVAVFDTAYFRDLPEAAATYAIDADVAERLAIRRYGFHGISHQYVAERAAATVGRPLAELRQVVLHLGNGASASAIDRGTPVDTSMGLTPIEGLVMGSRSGDVDPGVLLHLLRNGYDQTQLDDLLNHRSGLLGLCGESDLRDVHGLIAAGDERARLALDVYGRRLKKYIGAYVAVLGGLDVLTFTAGVGENDAVVRAEVASGLEVLGIELDPVRNAARDDVARTISRDGAPVTVLVVPTDEELAIARQVRGLLGV